MTAQIIPFRPRQPDSARDYWRDPAQALPRFADPFATFPVPTLAREPNSDLLAEIFGDAPISEQRLREIEQNYGEE